MTESKLIKVGLFGTCNDSTWRYQLIPLLQLDFFNPVVKDWTPACQAEERHQREVCDYVLYTITPRMLGVYSIAEVVDDSNKRPEKTIFCLLESDGPIKFSFGELKSLHAVADLVARNGAICFYSLEQVAKYLNDRKAESQARSLL